MISVQFNHNTIWRIPPQMKLTLHSQLFSDWSDFNPAILSAIRSMLHVQMTKTKVFSLNRFRQRSFCFSDNAVQYTNYFPDSVQSDSVSIRSRFHPILKNSVQSDPFNPKKIPFNPTQLESTPPVQLNYTYNLTV